MLIALALIVLAGMAYIRLSPNDPARWHVDPISDGVAGLHNGFLLRPDQGDAVAPVFSEPVGDLAKAINSVALAQPRTQLFAGSVATGWMTYITRSRLMGFPDFTSVKVIAAPGGSTFAAFARARFGSSDLGVNKERLDTWLTALGAH
ncbi:hypothetical protein GALL_456020 [mine drainage metagenome]|uniref:DUF1499 domain-containing protein n=1 Tax=mine drainage metagenome TaxID=410659 RepID=A0A1J5PY80_9ZZZZ